MTAQDIQYRSVQLYGGAMAADLPTTYSDVSDIRQVPDHQEVYLDTQGYSSIIFEILQRVEIPDGEAALKHHLADLVAEDMNDMKIWSCSGPAVVPSLHPRSDQAEKVQAWTILATTPPGEKMRGREREPAFVGVLLTMVRLVEVETDFLVVVNVPHVPGEFEEGSVDAVTGKMGPLLERAVAIREKVLGTLEVRDWGLFGEE
ncbi:Hypothetical protein R9X50_00716900 [Acrodontium crateriforme]|uniref:Ran guanine nucleotide release factor n=1 Tax=Acrodontium crateriforme TaxID=150365 RepID=A0AAQ3MAX9_9PEZI|nr:Hypothetical protein R9X50_00716900 [Acrodontium crateriforme]